MLRFNSSKLIIKLKYLHPLKGPFGINKITHILSDLKSGLAHIHTKNWVYNDLRRDNLIYRLSNNNFIIVDGDLTCISGEVCNGGTPHIKPLEYLYNQQSQQNSDVYSLGATLWGLFNNQLPSIARFPKCEGWRISRVPTNERVRVTMLGFILKV